MFNPTSVKFTEEGDFSFEKSRASGTGHFIVTHLELLRKITCCCWSQMSSTPDDVDCRIEHTLAIFDIFCPEIKALI